MKPCTCHSHPPCSYCTGESTEEDFEEHSRELAINSDNVELAQRWMDKNPGKCIWCKKPRALDPAKGGCYC